MSQSLVGLPDDGGPEVRPHYFSFVGGPHQNIGRNATEGAGRSILTVACVNKS